MRMMLVVMPTMLDRKAHLFTTLPFNEVVVNAPIFESQTDYFFGLCAMMRSLILSYSAAGRIPRVTNWFLAV
jgi:hypothetical protein